jgi:hypothetical protein
MLIRRSNAADFKFSFGLAADNKQSEALPSPHVDATREDGTVLNGDPRNDHISIQRTFASYIDVVTRFTSAVYMAKHHYLACRNRSRNLTVAPHRYTIAG